MVRVNPDPYLVLGVSPTATQAEITHAYRDPATRPSPRHPPCTVPANRRRTPTAAAGRLRPAP